MPFLPPSSQELLPTEILPEVKDTRKRKCVFFCVVQFHGFNSLCLHAHCHSFMAIRLTLGSHPELRISYLSNFCLCSSCCCHSFADRRDEGEKDAEGRPVKHNVGMCVVNREGLVFVAKHADKNECVWQMPQGELFYFSRTAECAMRQELLVLRPCLHASKSFFLHEHLTERAGQSDQGLQCRLPSPLLLACSFFKAECMLFGCLVDPG